MPLFTFPSVWNSVGYEKHDKRHKQFIKHVIIAPVQSTLISLYNCTPLSSCQLTTANAVSIWRLPLSRPCGDWMWGFLPNPFPRLGFSIHFTGETKSRGNAFQGMEKGPLPRMQQFSIW
jgi:hypothetical protein